MRSNVLRLPGFVTGDETGSATSSEGQERKAGRPRKYGSAAERQAAYRARNAGIVTWRLGAVAEQVAAIAAEVDMPANELAHQMLKFALSNRNWRSEPVFGRLLPNANARPKS